MAVTVHAQAFVYPEDDVRFSVSREHGAHLIIGELGVFPMGTWSEQANKLRELAKRMTEAADQLERGLPDGRERVWSEMAS